MKLLKLSALCFLLVFSFSISLLAVKHDQTIQKIFINRQRVTDSKLPLLANASSFPVLSAQGVIATDIDSAVVMYEKNADYPLKPASTTKILTALVALDAYSLDQIITVPYFNVIGQKMRLITGEKITTENLLYGLLVFSANDAAETFARVYPGGYDAFIQAMNKKAKELGMDNSHFVNPTGLDDNQHVSTARDMIRLAEIAMGDPEFAKIVGTREITVKSVDNRFVHRLTNINQLLGKVPGVEGVKTGWTEAARENLVTYVNRDGKKVLIALLGSQDRFGETEELIEWIYKNYSWQDLEFKN